MPIPPPPQSSRTLIDRSKVDPIVEPVVRAHGAEIFDIEFKSEAQGWVLRILVEKEGASEQRLSTKDAAVDIGICSKIAREVSPALDVADPIPHRYSLEVSSPGVERSLRGHDDYVRFSGLKAKIWVTQPVAGQRVLVGVLGAIKNDTLEVIDGSRTHDVPTAHVEKAKLVFEFGASAPPKSQRKKKG